jgi:hypothetical protein
LPDWGTFAYWAFILSLYIYFVVRTFSNPKFAAPFLFMIPAMIGIFGIFFIVPVRIFTFWITELILFFHLLNVPKNKPTRTVIVIGKNEYFKPGFWLKPNYDTDLLLLKKLLRLKGEDFSIFKNVTLEQLDEIMQNKTIKTVFLVGHGRRHGFVLGANTVVDYCRYDDKKFEKDFVYQIHCNQGGGKSLVEYVVPEKNQEECKPEHGYMSNITINQMFIDKIIKIKNLGRIKSFLLRIRYTLLTSIIPITVFLGWGYLFTKLVT